MEFELFCFIAVCIGFAGGAAAIGYGFGGILGVGIGLKASAAGATISSGVTVSGLSASFLGNKVKNVFRYGKEEKKLHEIFQKFKTDLEEIKYDFEEMSIKSKTYSEKIKILQD